MREARSLLSLQSEFSAAASDGLAAVCPDVVSLSACGSSGRNPQNAERDYMRTMRAEFEMPNIIMSVPSLRYVKASGKVQRSDISVLAIHRFFSEVHGTDHFAQLFGTPFLWATYWKANRHEKWYQEHPMKHLLDTEPERHVPYVVHGDDAPCSRRVGRNIRLISMHGVCALGHETLSKKIPLLILPNDNALSTHLEHSGKRAIVWSLNAANRNENPDSWPFGELPPWLARKAGKPLTDTGISLTYAAGVGDWEWYRYDFDLPWHYGAEFVCQQCPARKHGLVHNYANCADDADWSSQTREMSELIEHLLDTKPNVDQWNPLMQIRGFHTHSLMEDQVHSDCLGVRLQLCGSVLYELALQEAWGALNPTGDWSTKLDKVLHTAFVDFCCWCKKHKKSCSQSRFKTLNLCMQKQSDNPTLKAKAATREGTNFRFTNFSVHSTPQIKFLVLLIILNVRVCLLRSVHVRVLVLLIRLNVRVCKRSN